MKTGLFWGQKVKGQGHVSQPVCVGLQTERNIAAYCVSKPYWVFPAAMPRRRGHAIDIGFSLRLFPVANAGRRFFHAWSSRSAIGKNITVLGHDTLVGAGFV